LNAALGGGFLTSRGWGPALRVGYAYQFAESFDLGVNAAYQAHLSEERTTQWGGGTAQLAYRFDVLEWVPIVALGVGAYHFWDAPGPHGLDGLEISLRPSFSIERLLSRNFSVGVKAASDVFLTQDSKLTLDNIAFFTEFAYAWGW
jgi:hypothetical protein